MKKNKNISLYDKEFSEILTEQRIDAWYDQFNGIDYVKPVTTVIFVHSNLEELEKTISEYEKKYGGKLKYEINGCSYISQIRYV